MNEDRKRIQPFIDWIIDNNKEVNFGDLHDYMEEYLKEIKQGQTLPIHDVIPRFDIPNSEVDFAYYHNFAYLDEQGWYMKDQDGKIQRPDVKYLKINEV